VVVPAGAECALTPRGPGTPLMSDATPAFRAALARYDGTTATLRPLLKTARPQDGPTLHELLLAAPREQRTLLQRRLGELDASEKAPPKTHAKIKRATASGAKKTAPATQPVPAPQQQHQQQPARKAEPTKINHDALKGLERSIQ
jgi:hypothetical protein